MDYHNQKSRSFQVCQGVSQESVCSSVFLSFFINELSTFLPTSVCFSIYADNLATCSSSFLVPNAVENIKRALIRMER